MFNSTKDDRLLILPSVYAMLFLFSLNTRKAIRGCGTANQDELTENRHSVLNLILFTDRLEPGTHRTRMKGLPQSPSPPPIYINDEVYGLSQF